MMSLLSRIATVSRQVRNASLPYKAFVGCHLEFSPGGQMSFWGSEPMRVLLWEKNVYPLIRMSWSKLWVLLDGAKHWWTIEIVNRLASLIHSAMTESKASLQSERQENYSEQYLLQIVLQAGEASKSAMSTSRFSVDGSSYSSPTALMTYWT